MGMLFPIKLKQKVLLNFGLWRAQLMSSAFEMLVSAKEAKLIASGLKIVLSHLGQRYSLQSFISSSNMFHCMRFKLKFLFHESICANSCVQCGEWNCVIKSPTGCILTGQQSVKLKAAEKQWTIWWWTPRPPRTTGRISHANTFWLSRHALWICRWTGI